MFAHKINRYETERELCRGGMGAVYLARDPFTKRQVAIKVFSYFLSTDALFQERFQREAEVIVALEHPCIVPIYDFRQHGSQPNIVIRYMAGGSLQDRPEKEKMELHQLSRITDRVTVQNRIHQPGLRT